MAITSRLKTTKAKLSNLHINKDIVKVAAIQMASGPCVAANLNEAERLIEIAANQGAKLVVLPEYFAIMGLKETDKVGNELWNKMFHYYALNKEKFLERYHQRSNSETCFSMVKAKFGGTLRSKTRTAQINEALCKILCHNICCLIQSMFEFGVKPDFWKEI